jgi:hypothetical protein
MAIVSECCSSVLTFDPVSNRQCFSTCSRWLKTAPFHLTIFQRRKFRREVHQDSDRGTPLQNSFSVRLPPDVSIAPSGIEPVPDREEKAEALPSHGDCREPGRSLPLMLTL